MIKSYPEYKKSGVDWVDSIPSEWFSLAIKHLSTEPDTCFIDGNWIESVNLSEDGIRYLTTGNIGVGKYKEQGTGFISTCTFDDLKCTEVLPGDVLISRLNQPIGRACIVPELGIKIVTAVDNVILRPNARFDRKFLTYLFSCADYFFHTETIARGATMQRISRTQLGNIRIALPIDKNEQSNIAAYLDETVSGIDNLIFEKENFINLLKEKRQALISHVVTKGLDPNIKMKDSGVKWIGEVPSTWNVSSLGYALSAIGDVDHYMPDSIDQGIPYVMTGDLMELVSEINFDECKKVSEIDYLKLSKKIKTTVGDVIMAQGEIVNVL